MNNSRSLLYDTAALRIAILYYAHKNVLRVNLKLKAPTIIMRKRPLFQIPLNLWDRMYWNANRPGEIVQTYQCLPVRILACIL